MNKRTDILLDHYRNPRKNSVSEEASCVHEVFNRKCGDKVVLYATMDGEILDELRFQGEGCFYCLSSASILCEYVDHRNWREILKEVIEVRRWLAGNGSLPDFTTDDIDALSEIKNYPTRTGCVDLAWKGLEELLYKKEDGSHEKK